MEEMLAANPKDVGSAMAAAVAAPESNALRRVMEGKFSVIVAYRDPLMAVIRG
ncbi:hypothetical protein [Rhizobium leguminosarum]|uniref:hypothetical protein n=1 Tax=Rhizobium leguminosarum TaxID=384 RepID=UPI001FE2262A|nr:hypothetical protein [Rhizobium leguminosarum]WSH75961.1 hypothetical protein U8Q02_34925 [Rhizobium leguminosarum]